MSAFGSSNVPGWYLTWMLSDYQRCSLNWFKKKLSRRQLRPHVNNSLQFSVRIQVKSIYWDFSFWMVACYWVIWNLLNSFCVKLCRFFTSVLLMAPPGFHKVRCGGDRNHLWWIMQLFESESVRLVLPCRDREASNISGGVMFDWGLLVPPVLFLFVNRLSGNVVIIVAEASICLICVEGRGELPSFQIHFPRCWWEAAGWRGWSGAWSHLIYPEVWTHSVARLSLLVPANGSNPAGFDCEPGWWVIHFTLWLTTKRGAFQHCTLQWLYCSGVWSERHKTHKQPGHCGSRLSAEASRSRFAYWGAQAGAHHPDCLRGNSPHL